LIGEFSALAARRGAQIVLARCDAHTTTVAFRALARLLRATFTVDGLNDADARAHVLAQCDGTLSPGSADAQILFDVMGIGDPDAPPLQVSVDGRRRRVVEVMSEAVFTRSVRILFVLEDAHWIDAPSDEVLADFSDALKATSSMFVTTFRPEYDGALQHHSDERIALQPLTDAMTLRLVRQLLGNDPSLMSLAERIAGAAAGNPFFVEEIVRDLSDRGVLSGSRGGYRLIGTVDEITVPVTVQAVLAARIDRLSTETKAVLNAAAVIGNRFDVDTLQALLPEDLSSLLRELVSTELIDQTEFMPRQRYCFRHPLVRTVAYESQLSTTRAQAHRRPSHESARGDHHDRRREAGGCGFRGYRGSGPRRRPLRAARPRPPGRLNAAVSGQVSEREHMLNRGRPSEQRVAPFGLRQNAGRCSLLPPSFARPRWVSWHALICLRRFH
jgi:adenylate cyclase